ncbi:MAG: tRNA uridine-5-carboxymethylaminomethyl(34) synthesis GTPase MnmE [Flavobacteriales bacterium]|jgi:tRNA modification GTPase|uniref:tRNA uridine-5-carboxymethylaminomethyl(34) synthesis GTPase MnmE n=1 Tax=Blattabacterium sp. (Mastotermes darwiniensis) TaxID=39768 RepID=UPI000231DF6E|nr:tRNA uridine-5-carboxymethylaminomethyl(34) synthesis GTPase MnmE [Blattabacterium sp. (Mastotermes darwiniensis)]AER40390.1 tRNA modification GTPase [Blattabacterium sp. (Mastotermes darwiniensis) str. MADAR]MDR1804889.1 tRNA uridine-5-carboxymethylaminomethyl(34) synthesis GTPase MnmE [Flavobacteriales bacterium]
MLDDDTIVALATPPGSSAISVIRISGKNSISTIGNIFISVQSGKKLEDQSTHTIHLGYIVDDKKKDLLDQVLVSIFKSPLSYTGEDMIEISCHGSYYIQQQILQLLIRKGLRLARPGEFTFRAFSNNKIDLSQAEAIADLIFSENKAYHEISLKQIKGTLTNTIKNLRKKLLDFASLLELELDFSEENVVLVKRSELFSFLKYLEETLKDLIESFSLGNAIKRGIYVSIIGETNVGKSTLFNHVIKENRSIISHIEGTTRDSIEGELILNGIHFHFVDTAGIRETKDPIEMMGIQKTMEKIKDSQAILYLFDASIKDRKKQKKIVNEIKIIHEKYPLQKILVIANKSDISSFIDHYNLKSKVTYFFEISAKNHHGIKSMLYTLSNLFIEKIKEKNIIVTQNRHYEAFKKSLKEVLMAHKALNQGRPEDLVAIHIKGALHYLGEITGEITNEEVLKNIFSKFCIGK